jgi:hypothetical protein
LGVCWEAGEGKGGREGGRWIRGRHRKGDGGKKDRTRIVAAALADDPAERGHAGGDGGVDVVAVKAHAGFEAEGVAGGEAGPFGGGGGEDGFGDGLCESGGRGRFSVFEVSMNVIGTDEDTEVSEKRQGNGSANARISS